LEESGASWQAEFAALQKSMHAAVDAAAQLEERLRAEVAAREADNRRWSETHTALVAYSNEENARLHAALEAARTEAAVEREESKARSETALRAAREDAAWATKLAAIESARANLEHALAEAQAALGVVTREGALAAERARGLEAEATVLRRASAALEENVGHLREDLGRMRVRAEDSEMQLATKKAQYAAAESTRAELEDANELLESVAAKLKAKLADLGKLQAVVARMDGPEANLTARL
jgi:chromosome segregation ATPase